MELLAMRDVPVLRLTTADDGRSLQSFFEQRRKFLLEYREQDGSTTGAD